MSLLLVPKAFVAQHQVIMSLQVLRIDRENSLQHVHSFRVFALEEKNASQIVQRHTIPWILRENPAEMVSRVVVAAIAAQNFGIEEMGSRQVGTQRQRLRQHS